MQLVVTSSDTSMLVARYLGTYRGTDCQKSATDVELKLLTVIPDARCSSYTKVALTEGRDRQLKPQRLTQLLRTLHVLRLFLVCNSFSH